MFAYDTVAASSMLSGFVAVIVSRPCYLSASVRPVWKIYTDVTVRNLQSRLY